MDERAHQPNFQSETDLSSSPLSTGQGEGIVVEGLAHSQKALEARRYRTREFVCTLLSILQDLTVPSWDDTAISPDDLEVFKVSGSLTNAVFFVSAPHLVHPPRTVLLRIYGHSSSLLISRPRELFILHALSSVYQIGPRIYGTFESGRVEEYLASQPLTREEMTSAEISRWIGRRMNELHDVDISEVMVDAEFWEASELIALKQNVANWYPLAKEVIRSIDLLHLPDDHHWCQAIRAINIEDLMQQWEAYISWVYDWEAIHGKSRRVFAHNDTQCGNLLRLKLFRPGRPSHHQIVVVDFEYAAPNPAAFDIANHFHEWTANYHGETPHLLNPSLYPNLDQRRNFYHAYLSPLPVAPSSSNLLRSSGSSGSLSLENFVSAASNPIVDAQLEHLEGAVQAWSPASHAMWCIWGIVQAKEDVMSEERVSEFDYLEYAKGRALGFRNEIALLGIQTGKLRPNLGVQL